MPYGHRSVSTSGLRRVPNTEKGPLTTSYLAALEELIGVNIARAEDEQESEAVGQEQQDEATRRAHRWALSPGGRADYTI